MWLKKHKFKTIRTLDILDCNGGDHGQPFATNFNPGDQHPRSHRACAALGERRQFVETPAMAQEGRVRLRGRRPQEHVHDVSRGARKPRQVRARNGARALLDDLRRRSTSSTSTVLQNVGMTRIDPVHLQRAGDHPAAVPQGGAARTRQPRPDDQGQDQYRLHRHRRGARRHRARRPSTSRTSATMRTPMPKPATRRSATPPASRR